MPWSRGCARPGGGARKMWWSFASPVAATRTALKWHSCKAKRYKNAVFPPGGLFAFLPRHGPVVRGFFRLLGFFVMLGEKLMGFLVPGIQMEGAKKELGAEHAVFAQD